MDKLPSVSVQFVNGEYQVYVNGEKVDRLRKLESTRYLFKYKDLIIKVDPWKKHLDEVTFWDLIVLEEDRQYFVPVVDWDDEWAAYPFLKFDYCYNREQEALMIQIAGKYGIWDIYQSARMPNNWAVCNGKPIIYDYEAWQRDPRY